MWLGSSSTNEEPLHSQGKAKLSIKNGFISWLLINLLKLKILDPVGFIKV